MSPAICLCCNVATPANIKHLATLLSRCRAGLWQSFIQVGNFKLSFNCNLDPSVASSSCWQTTKFALRLCLVSSLVKSVFSFMYHELCFQFSDRRRINREVSVIFIQSTTRTTKCRPAAKFCPVLNDDRIENFIETTNS